MNPIVTSIMFTALSEQSEDACSLESTELEDLQSVPRSDSEDASWIRLGVSPPVLVTAVDGVDSGIADVSPVSRGL